MNQQEKSLARILFQNKIYKSDGQAYEDLFTEVMIFLHNDFRRIKAWGNIGDRKNDGYIDNKGIYFQVYAPEDIRNSYPKAIAKMVKDFYYLYSHWDTIKEFYFVINDKFKGVNADSEQAIKKLKQQYNLSNTGIYTAKDLEKSLFSLSDDKILTIIGFLPNPDLINLDYSILHEVIGYIMRLPLIPITGEIKYPDWNEKIKFNNLSQHPEYLLNTGSQQLGALNKYLEQNTTLAEELQKQMTAIYNNIKNNWSNLEVLGDNIFWEIINNCSPKNESQYQNAVITIMAKYFESCDIFEEPEKSLLS